MKKSGFAVVAKHTSWSPSKLGCWEECPAKASYKYLHKLPDPGGPALVRGSWVHEQCENYVSQRIKKLATTMVLPDCPPLEVQWNEETLYKLNRLRRIYSKGHVRTEMDMAFTAAWKSCEWMAQDVWARMKMDLLELDPKRGTIKVTDWKTGRYKPDGEYDDQLKIYCVAALTALPEYKVATASLWFTDVGKEVTRPQGVLTRAGLAAEQARWTKKVSPMFNDTVHAPTPNPTCRYCPYSVQRRGPCKF